MFLLRQHAGDASRLKAGETFDLVVPSFQPALEDDWSRGRVAGIE